jgi:hypothetical protein
LTFSVSTSPCVLIWSYSTYDGRCISRSYAATAGSQLASQAEPNISDMWQRRVFAWIAAHIYISFVLDNATTLFRSDAFSFLGCLLRGGTCRKAPYIFLHLSTSVWKVQPTHLTRSLPGISITDGVKLPAIFLMLNN